MSEGATQPKKDFFISYNKADRAWAEWIAWQLETAGYNVWIQTWDFRSGSNFVVEMDRATRECERVIVVLSPDYLSSVFAQPEWASFFAREPVNPSRAIIPVRVRECAPIGLLAGLTFLDLVGKEETEAKRQLIDSIETLRSPQVAPTFPGSAASATLSTPRFPGTLPDIWNVPYPRDPAFTAPDERIAELREALSQKPAVLFGPGGVGKTALAIEYAYRYAGDYDIVWWLRCGQSATLVGDYVALGQKLELPGKGAAEKSAMIPDVREFLQKQSGWLVIFDNAENPAQIVDFLPGTGGHILITSRYAAWGAVANKVDVRAWPPNVAVEFLTRRTGQADVTAAAEIARELGYLPLLLLQAAAYVESTGRTLSEYRALLNERLDPRRGDPDRYDQATLARVLELTINRLETNSPVGGALLKLCAFFAPVAIARDVIVSGAKNLPEPLQSAARDKSNFDASVAAIHPYSLIEIGDDLSLCMHPQVQDFVRKRLGEQGSTEWVEAAVNLINAAFHSGSGDGSNRNSGDQLLPHAIATADMAEKLGVALDATAQLSNQVGVFALNRADYGVAKAAFERALRIFERKFGFAHPAVATCLTNLASVLHSLGDFAGAQAALQRALTTFQTAVGPKDPNLATVLNNLGNVLLDLGDMPGAEAAFARALHIDQEAFGPEHPNLARDLNNLGQVRLHLGDLDGAKAEYERALRIDEKAFGSDHPDVARDLDNLGRVVRAQGDPLGAKIFHERALRIDELRFGPDHPYVAIGLNNLGLVLQDLDDVGTAQPIFKRALAIMTQAFGSEHPHTKAIRRNLEELTVRQA